MDKKKEKHNNSLAIEIENKFMIKSFDHTRYFL